MLDLNLSNSNEKTELEICDYQHSAERATTPSNYHNLFGWTRLDVKVTVSALIYFPERITALCFVFPG